MNRIEKIAEDIVNSEVSDFYNPNSMFNMQQQKEKCKLEVQSALEMKNTTDRIKKAIEFVCSSEIFSPEEKKRIKSDIEQMASVISEIEDESILQDCYNISDFDMALWYRAALDCYKKHSYEESVNIFTLLIMLNSSVESYWLGLGGAEQMLRHYQLAICAYETALQITPHNGLTHLLIAQCFLLLNDKNNAQVQWKAAKESIAENGSQPYWNELMEDLESKLK